jgi:hypothetical protein
MALPNKHPFAKFHTWAASWRFYPRRRFGREIAPFQAL